MTKIVPVTLKPRQRKNLTTLADYLESLPEDYAHFDMEQYIDHRGGCDLTEALDEETQKALKYDDYCTTTESTVFARSAEQFLNNCGTVACALGHGPSAGIPLMKKHFGTKKVKGVSVVTNIDFNSYAKLFINDSVLGDEWKFLFSDEWKGIDDHHWGAAARIRFLLDKRGLPGDPDPNYAGTLADFEDAMEVYAPYRVDVRAPVAA